MRRGYLCQGWCFFYGSLSKSDLATLLGLSDYFVYPLIHPTEHVVYKVCSSAPAQSPASVLR